MANRLAGETSPYLLQHAHNPVDWYPWGPEALERARREDKPILLSIGYAACHWCHVMERESFENPAIAALMNELFVNIKVDREERPDLDAIYMQAVQAMTGHGGWPMTMFLLPTGEPYYGGTYFPPTDRHGMPGFPRVLQALAAAWREDRGRVEETGARVRGIYDRDHGATGSPDAASASHLRQAVRALADQFDRTFGGFGGAPKFPPTMALDFLLRQWARTGDDAALAMVSRTFLAMARGGVSDQVGGGIHRYSVDERWLVPHFEKMLYDNALFIRLGAHLWQATHDQEVREATVRAVAWVAREMVDPAGGFHSSLDADSEGHEGVFYVWTPGELDAVLGDDAELVRAAWRVTPAGNFEGRSILHLTESPSEAAVRLGVAPSTLAATLDRARHALLNARSTRVRPATDDKVLASWNGLMIRALCAAATAFDDPGAQAMAERAGDFMRTHMVVEGRVMRSWRRGQLLQVAFLEDAAAAGLAFLDLFSLTGDASWIEAARIVCARLVADFRDPESGTFFDTPVGHEALLARPRDITDNAMPSGTSLAAELLTLLATFDGDDRLAAFARSVIDGLAAPMARHPLAFGHLAGVADVLVAGPVEVAIPGGPPELMAAMRDTYVPSAAVATDAGACVLTQGRAPGWAYVCRRFVCDRPTREPNELAAQLRDARRSPP